jgi:hypothetical protein
LSKILVISDQHADPRHSNERADYLSQLIIDAKPDVVVNIGDAADMASLSSYDKGKRSFVGRNYRDDINCHVDFQSRIWDPVRARKKRMPQTFFLEGNHEHRIEKALDLSPELDGAISFAHLELGEWYNEIVRYVGSTPGKVTIDGISFAHYFVSGVMGRAISGEHPATSLLAKQFHSCVAGHLHLADYSVRTDALGRKMCGLVAGVYQDYDPPYAGDAARLWWRGVVMLHNAEKGSFDPEFISIDRLKKNYENR